MPPRFWEVKHERPRIFPGGSHSLVGDRDTYTLRGRHDQLCVWKFSLMWAWPRENHQARRSERRHQGGGNLQSGSLGLCRSSLRRKKRELVIHSWQEPQRPGAHAPFGMTGWAVGGPTGRDAMGRGLKQESKWHKWGAPKGLYVHEPLIRYEH